MYINVKNEENVCFLKTHPLIKHIKTNTPLNTLYISPSVTNPI